MLISFRSSSTHNLSHGTIAFGGNNNNQHTNVQTNVNTEEVSKLRELLNVKEKELTAQQMRIENLLNQEKKNQKKMKEMQTILSSQFFSILIVKLFEP